MERYITFIVLRIAMRRMKLVAPESFDAVVYGKFIEWCNVNGFEPFRPWWRCKKKAI